MIRCGDIAVTIRVPDVCARTNDEIDDVLNLDKLAVNSSGETRPRFTDVFL